MIFVNISKISLGYMILVMIIFCIISNNGFAATESNDCIYLLNGLDPQSQASKVIQDLKLTFFDQQDLTTAYTFAIRGCCDEQPGLEQCKNKTYNSKYHPDSNYLFDHLVYVGMNKLDGNKEHCDILQITCHPQATQRRSTITNIAIQRSGVPPSRIIGEYLKYRGDESKSIFDKDTPYLGAQYRRMCNEAYQIINTQALSQSADPLKAYKDQTPFQGCQRIIQQRYLQEIEYIKTLQIEKGLKFASDHIKNYITTYLYENRGITMLDTLQELNTGLTHVLSLIQRTTNCCAK